MSVRPCPNCGEPLHTRWFDNVAWCPYCHKPNRTIRAANCTTCVCCGAIVPEGRMICPNCDEGKEIE